MKFSIFSVFTLGILRINCCNAVIILDSGNPARFIRGTFVDVNQPEFFVTVDEKVENQFQVEDSVQQLNENIVTSLENFNEAMTFALKKQVEKTDAASAVDTCRFSRSRLLSTRIQNNIETLLTKLATAGIEDENEQTLQISETLMADILHDFSQMIEDLSHYDEGLHGKEAMTHFQKALKNYDSLRLVLASM